MVAHLVRLRLLLLKNSLLRSPWQLVAAIIGGLYGLGMLGLLTAGLIALSAAPVEVVRITVVLGGSAVILGWMLAPLITAGIDQTLDPMRLVTFPLSLNQLLLGLTASGVIGVPGLITLIAALATAGSWWQHPLAALAACLCAVIAVLTCVTGSRLVTTISTRLSSMRRFREVTGLIALIPLVLLGPIILGVTSGVRDAKDLLPTLAEILSWTPLGALWAVPADVAAGSFGRAFLHFVIGLATLAAFALLWRASLRGALVTPAHAAARRTAKGKLGFLGVLPATVWGAVAARCLTYWIRDPRYGKQLILVPIIPILMYFYSTTTEMPGLFNATAPIVALLLSLSIFADVSFDNTAFALHLSRGVRGRADRLGRVVALGAFASPAVVVIAVGTAWISSSWWALPGVLGVSLGLLLSGYGLSSVTSARVVFPVPAPGDSPFKSPPGAGLMSAVSTFATWGILWALVLPELVLTIIGVVTGEQLFGWLSLAVAGLLGTTVLVLGLRLGGTMLDRRGPELLAQLQRQA